MADEVPFVSPVAYVPPPPPTPENPFAAFSFGGLAASVALGSAVALFRPLRSIGGIVADVTVEEVAHDELEITHHPVERGATITDHAFKRQPEIIIRCGWSASGRGTGYTEAVYQALLDLQDSREPFEVVTGKRSYRNLLMLSLAQTTDVHSENALFATVVCREITIVESTVATVAPRAQQAQPQNTQPTETQGQKQPVPAKERTSIFYDLRQGAGGLLGRI